MNKTIEKIFRSYKERYSQTGVDPEVSYADFLVVVREYELYISDIGLKELDPFCHICREPKNAPGLPICSAGHGRMVTSHQPTGRLQLRRGWDARRELLLRKLQKGLKLCYSVAFRQHKAVNVKGALRFEGSFEEFKLWRDKTIEVAEREIPRLQKRIKQVKALQNPYISYGLPRTSS